MKYKLRDNLGRENLLKDISELKGFLSQPFENWMEGSGDSAITVKKDEQMIFFKIEQGVFLMQHPDYLSPLFDRDNDKSVIHYVGGEPMIIPEKFLCSEEITIEILSRYIESGTLHNAYQWLEIYE